MHVFFFKCDVQISLYHPKKGVTLDLLQYGLLLAAIHRTFVFITTSAVIEEKNLDSSLVGLKHFSRQCCAFSLVPKLISLNGNCQGFASEKDN